MSPLCIGLVLTIWFLLGSVSLLSRGIRFFGKTGYFKPKLVISYISVLGQERDKVWDFTGLGPVHLQRCRLHIYVSLTCQSVASSVYVKTHETGKRTDVKCDLWGFWCAFNIIYTRGPLTVVLSPLVHKHIPCSFSHTFFWTAKPWLSLQNTASSSPSARFGTNSVPIRDSLDRSLPLFH